MSATKTAGWYAMTLLAIGVSLYGIAIVAVPPIRNHFLVDLFARSGVAAHAHLLGGAVALAIGPFQLSQRIRQRALTVHRFLGRVYIVAILVGGLGALSLSFSASGGLAGRFGFGLMAVAWLISTGMAFLRIRQRRIAEHQVWMIRSYAITLAAVTLRFYLPLSMAAGLDFNAVYPAIAWLCWVPNLIVAEWFVLRRAAA